MKNLIIIKKYKIKDWANAKINIIINKRPNKKNNGF